MSCEISSLNYAVALGTKASKSLFTSSETLPVTVVIDRKAIVRDLIQGIMFSEELIKKSNRSYRREGATPFARSRRHKLHTPKIQRVSILVNAQGNRLASAGLDPASSV
jgi:hypothetical protein